MNDSGETLARVTYLPGVIPPSSESFSSNHEAQPDVSVESEQLPESRDRAIPLAARPLVPLRDDSSVTALRVSQEQRAAVARETLERWHDGLPADDDPEEPEEAPETEGEKSARAANISMHALARRGVSLAEMTVLLTSRDLDYETVEAEVARLEGVGLLDDTELAGALIRQMHERKGLGRSAITAELRRRKIDPTSIEIALAELDGDDELERATEIAVKRAPQLRSLDTETAKRRLGAFLMRKGYGGSVVSSAVATALAGGSYGRNSSPSRGPRFQ